LEGIGELDLDDLKSAIADADARVRANAVRLCERKMDSMGDLVLSRVSDSSMLVRRQVAYTLGEWKD
jgi:hypothetical protein